MAGPIAGPGAAWPASKCSTYPPSVTPLLAVLWIYITVVIALHLPVESVLEWGSLLDFNLIWQTGRRQRRKNNICALRQRSRGVAPWPRSHSQRVVQGPIRSEGTGRERWCVFIARARSTRRTCGSMSFLTAPHARAHTQATDIEEIDPNTRVSVGAAMLIKGFLSSYHEYKIDCTPSLTSSIITHRYSDFDWLYKHLVVAFPGVPIPKLPPKETSSIFSSAKNKNATFLDLRRVGLEMFLQSLVWVPYVRECPAVKAFLTTSGGKFRKAQRDLGKTLYTQETSKYFAVKMEDHLRTRRGSVTMRGALIDDKKKKEGDESLAGMTRIMARTRKSLQSLPILRFVKAKGLEEFVRSFGELCGMESDCTFRDAECRRVDVRKQAIDAILNFEATPVMSAVSSFAWECSYTDVMSQALRGPSLVQARVKKAEAAYAKAVKNNSSNQEDAKKTLDLENQILSLVSDAVEREHFPRYWNTKMRIAKKESTRIARMLADQYDEQIHVFGGLYERLTSQMGRPRKVTPDTIEFLGGDPTAVAPERKAAAAEPAREEGAGDASAGVGGGEETQDLNAFLDGDSGAPAGGDSQTAGAVGGSSAGEAPSAEPAARPALPSVPPPALPSIPPPALPAGGAFGSGNPFGGGGAGNPFGSVDAGAATNPFGSAIAGGGGSASAYGDAGLGPSPSVPGPSASGGASAFGGGSAYGGGGSAYGGGSEPSAPPGEA